VRGYRRLMPLVSATHLAALLDAAVARRRCEAILLSGGLDTSIVAALAARHGLRFAVTVAVGDDPPDLAYATAVARRLRIEHVVLRRTVAELATVLPELIALLNTFDGMYLRNDIVVLEGLREVARRGIRSCWTGDGADELFAGYSFVYTKAPDEIVATIKRFAASMHFSGTLIGEKLGVEVRSPYLEPEIIAHALTLGGEDLVLDHDGQRLGKAPLRRVRGRDRGTSRLPQEGPDRDRLRRHGPQGPDGGYGRRLRRGGRGRGRPGRRAAPRSRVPGLLPPLPRGLRWPATARPRQAEGLPRLSRAGAGGHLLPR